MGIYAVTTELMGVSFSFDIQWNIGVIFKRKRVQIVVSFYALCFSWGIKNLFSLFVLLLFFLNFNRFIQQISPELNLILVFSFTFVSICLFFFFFFFQNIIYRIFPFLQRLSWAIKVNSSLMLIIPSPFPFSI